MLDSNVLSKAIIESIPNINPPIAKEEMMIKSK
jgi:hypothetical protein